MEIDEAQQFMRQHLGANWEEVLVSANAFPSPGGGSRGDVDACERRAVELISEIGNDWTHETHITAADAWNVLWRE